MAEHKSRVQQEPVTTQGGSGPFRALNFELYTVRLSCSWGAVLGRSSGTCACTAFEAEQSAQIWTSDLVDQVSGSAARQGTGVKNSSAWMPLQKPVGKMKVLAYVGSAAAAGILGYMVIQKQEMQRTQKPA